MRCTPPGHQAAVAFCLAMIAIEEDRLTVRLAGNYDENIAAVHRALEKFGPTEHVIDVPNGAQASAYLTGSREDIGEKELPVPDLLILEQGLGSDGLEALDWLRRQPAYDQVPVVLIGRLSTSEQNAVKRLNAACCPMEAKDDTELHRALGDAMVDAFRLASLIPDGAWYRGVETTAFGSRPRPRLAETKFRTPDLPEEMRRCMEIG